MLDACYVEPGARGVGLGRLLLDTTASWLAARGCRGVDGVALPGDREAKNFYESAGFKARLLTMHRELD
jgi:GNAT superfamily N-acetyltransferase